MLLLCAHSNKVHQTGSLRRWKKRLRAYKTAAPSDHLSHQERHGSRISFVDVKYSLCFHRLNTSHSSQAMEIKGGPSSSSLLLPCRTPNYKLSAVKMLILLFNLSASFFLTFKEIEITKSILRVIAMLRWPIIFYEGREITRWLSLCLFLLFIDYPTYNNR